MEAVARNPEEALKPRRQMRIKPLRFKPFMAGEAWGDIMEPRPLGGRVRAIRPDNRRQAAGRKAP